MKKIASIMFAAVVVVFLTSCASASSESEVMVDTSAKTRTDIPGGLPGSDDTSRLSDPFLSGGN